MRHPRYPRQPKAERVLEIAREVLRLEQELRLRRAELDRLVAEPGTVIPKEKFLKPPEAPARAPPMKPALARTTTLPDMIQELMDLHPNDQFTAQVISDQLCLGLESVRSALSKLVKRGTVERLGGERSGIYRAVGGYRKASNDDD